MKAVNCIRYKQMLTVRDKLILTGLFLSKFDIEGLEILGFKGFMEAYNTIAISIGARPASIKNYRDEFDPYFPNKRNGWHKRTLRPYCRVFFEKYGDYDIETFSNLIKTEISVSGDIELLKENVDSSENNSFAKRMITGQAAERYFEKIYPSLSAFSGYNLINTTMMGCGFDYKVNRPPDPFFAVEVKGINAPVGLIQFTSKEYKMAQMLEDRFFLFVVRNFVEMPAHTLVQHPIESGLIFERHESTSVQVCWSTCLGKECIEKYNA